MNGRGFIQVPHEWEDLPNPKYFFTYYGDVYVGSIFYLPEFDDRFFIVPNDRKKEVNNLTKEERTLENFRKLGWEIKDPKIIRDFAPNGGLIGEDTAKQRSSFTTYEIPRKMFIFGAGASANSVFGDKSESFKNDVIRPPAGFEIFDERFEGIIQEYPGAKNLIPAFEANGKDIEQCLQKDWEVLCSSFKPELISDHINLQLYIKGLFSTISEHVYKKYYRGNLYSLFAKKLNEKLPSEIGATIVSFNYDTILEKFLEGHLRYKFSSLTDYLNIKEGQIQFFKPHGSANWGWPLRKDLPFFDEREGIPELIYDAQATLYYIYFDYLGPPNKMLAENGWGYEKSLEKNSLGKLTVNKDRLEVVSSGYRKFFYPALLLPYRDKDEFVMPYKHHSVMKRSIQECEEIYIIGWKGNEDVFNRLLKKQTRTLKSVYIIDPDFESVKENLSHYLNFEEVHVEHLANTFEEFVLHKMDAIFQIKEYEA